MTVAGLAALVPVLVGAGPARAAPPPGTRSSAAPAGASAVSAGASAVSAGASAVSAASAGARSAASGTALTEDGYYCRYVRRMQGSFYYEVVSTSTELVPISEVHTGSNVFAKFSYSQNVTVSLAGGLSVSGGGWDLSGTSGASQTVTISRDLPVFGGGRDSTIYAVWGYQTRRVVCYNTDPRSGQMIRRDATSRFRYLPTNWTTELAVAGASRSVPHCATGRSGEGVGRARLVSGESNALGVTWATAYTAGMTLKTIGVSATVSVTSGSAQAFRFWTSRGTSWVCGNAATLRGSNRLYANGL